MKKIIISFYVFISFCSCLLAQSVEVRDSLVKYLIKSNELHPIANDTVNLHRYHNSMYIIPILRCKNDCEIGFYRFGANYHDNKEFILIIQNATIKILKGQIDKDIDTILNFFEENISCFDKKEILQCLKEIIEINRKNDNQKTEEW